MNIIHGRTPARLNPLLEELQRQSVSNYEIWDSIYLKSVKASINAAHKQIVEFAQVAGWNEVLIAEDDFIGTHENSFKFFLSQKPKDYDLYLSMIYMGDIDENNRVKDFSGMTLYMVHSRFYDTFLNVDPEEHIDRALSGKGEFVVCNPFAFVQRNGFSSNTGKSEVYDTLLAGRKLYFGI